MRQRLKQKKKRTKEQLEKRYGQLRQQIEKNVEKHIRKQYHFLSEAYSIGKELHGRPFGYKDLANDFKMSFPSVVRLMSLKKANARTWRLIDDGKISVRMASLILHRASEVRQDTLIDTIINEGFTSTDIMNMTTKSAEEFNEDKMNISIQKGYAQRQHAWRAINTALKRIDSVCLIHPENIPKERINQTIGSTDKSIESLRIFRASLTGKKNLITRGLRT